MIASTDDAAARLDAAGYLADPATAMAVFLAVRLGKPILAEGPAGVGKTELAKALARALDARLIRLQCYEGLDEARTLYEWKYGKQLLYIQLLRDAVSAELAGAWRESAEKGDDGFARAQPVRSLAEAVDRLSTAADPFFSEQFLDPRPLLQAVRATEPVVLLIDEVDRAEDELEAFFLEVLAEFQVTIPELGTFRAPRTPAVVLTSNATRELSDALRRRCLYLPMAYPSAAREAAIVERHVPEVGAKLAAELAAFVGRLRTLELRKRPSIAEAIDWARALILLGATSLDPEVVRSTLSLLVKYEGDLDLARAIV